MVDKNTLYNLTAAQLGYVTMAFPALATIFAVGYSIFFDFRGSTATHCRVLNILPSVSAAIGRTPQQFIWQIFISLHSAPRFMFALSYYGWHKQVNVGKNQNMYLMLVKIAVFFHIVENLMLVLLTCISSNDNKDIHENSFILFIVTAWIYMLLTLAVCLWSSPHRDRLEKEDLKSFKYKKIYAFTNIASFSLATYLYFRHNRYCEPYVYSLFAVCEYITIFTNILFHGTAVIDMREYSVAVVLTDLLDKHK